MNGTYAVRPVNAAPQSGANPLSHVLGVGAVFAFLACYMVFDNRPAIAWAILTIAAAAAVALQRYRDYGLLDPLGIFSFFFLAYNGVLLLRLATMDDPTATVYPWPFNQEAYGKAGMLDAIAAVTMFVTATFLARLHPKSRTPNKTSVADPTRSPTAWLIAGVAVYLLGLTLYFVQYQQVGGYLAGLKMGRGQRFTQFQGAGLSWPYLPFLLPGLAAIWYAAAQSRARAKKWVAYAALLSWCALVLVQGDRLLVVQAVMAAASVYLVSHGRRVQLRSGLFALIALAVLAALYFGYARSVIAPRIAGEMTDAEVQNFLESNPIVDQVKPERTELAGPYLSLLQIVTDSEGDILQGTSYGNALLSILPKALYPGEKPAYLSERFAESIHIGRSPVSGWGFNPVAEAYLNLGIFGAVIAFAIWTAGFHLLGECRERGPFGLLLFAVLLPEAVDANRIDFRNVYCIFVYFTAGVIITYLIATILESLTANISPMYKALAGRARMGLERQ